MLCMHHNKVIQKEKMFTFRFSTLFLSLLSWLCWKILPLNVCQDWQSENTRHAFNLLRTSHPHRIAFTIEERVVFWTTDNICRWLGQMLGEMRPWQVKIRSFLTTKHPWSIYTRCWTRTLSSLWVLFKSNMQIWSQAILVCSYLMNSVNRSNE